MILYVIINSDNKNYSDTIENFPSDNSTITIYAADSLEKASTQDWVLKLDMRSATIYGITSSLKETGAYALVFPDDIYIPSIQPKNRWDYISQYPSPPESRNAEFRKQIVRKFTNLS